MKRALKITAVVLLLALGLGLRLYDLTDQPLDFHPTRQLRGALIARSMYYQMLPNPDPDALRIAVGIANTTGQYEPSIVEKIVAITYLFLGGEVLWVSRIYTSLFWLIGGVALYDLARRMTSFGGALVALAYYLVLPFAVQASRSFQPDPGMVMWIILSVYAFYRWSAKPSWKWAILAGALGGMAVLTKVVAGYIVGGAAVAVVLSTLGVRRFWRSPQVWSMALLMLAPSALYYLSRGGRASEYISGWTLSLSHLLVPGPGSDGVVFPAASAGGCGYLQNTQPLSITGTVDWLRFVRVVPALPDVHAQLLSSAACPNHRPFPGPGKPADHRTRGEATENLAGDHRCSRVAGCNLHGRVIDHNHEPERFPR
jgi:hypothetical protein